MLNQPQPVFSYTIPYYITNFGESSELFVSEKTYERFLQAQQKIPLTVISGELHPISASFGRVTSTLFDQTQAILVLGTSDLAEYTSEVMDITIAAEIERILLFDKRNFIRYLYHGQTPEHIQIFIDDIQQSLEDIMIAKQLIKRDYRVSLREEELMNEVIKNAQALSNFKKVNPYTIKEALYLLNKLFSLYHIDQDLYKKYKQFIQPFYPQLFIEHEKLQKLIQKLNLSTHKGRQKATEKILKMLQYDIHTKKISITDIPAWQLPPSITPTHK